MRTYIFIRVSHTVKPTSTLNMAAVSTVPAEKVILLCPDCPMYSSADDEQVKKTLTLSLEKFNKEGGLDKHFALLQFNRALVSVSLHVLLWKVPADADQ